jgi:hypothetical protein
MIGAGGVWDIEIPDAKSRLGQLANKQSRIGKRAAPVFIGRVQGADREGGGIPSVYELKAGIARQMKEIGDALSKAGDHKGATAFYQSSIDVLQSVTSEDYEKPSVEVDPDDLGPGEEFAVLNTSGVTEGTGQPGGSGEGSGSGTGGSEGSPSSGGGGGDGGEGGGDGGGNGGDGDGGGGTASSGEGDGADRDTGSIRFGQDSNSVDFFGRMFGLLGQPALPGRDTGDPSSAAKQGADAGVQGASGAIVAIVWEGFVDPSPESEKTSPKLRGRPLFSPGDTAFRDPLPIQLKQLAQTSERFAP